MSNDYQDYLEQKHATFNTPSAMIDAVVNTAVGSKLKVKEKVILGEVNEVYDVTTEDERQIIVRITRSNHPRFAAEKWALDQVREIKIPVPKVLLITSQQGLTFCVETKLSGFPLKDIRWQEQDRIKKLIIQAGAVLAKIHSIKPTGFGGLGENGQGKFSTWLDFIMEIEDEKEEVLKSATKMDLPVEDIAKGFTVLEKNKSCFENVIPHLLHGDFSIKHILIENDIISGIIDFESCKSGDTMWDFAWWSYFFGKDIPIEWLKEGYSQISELDPDFDKKLILYKIHLGLGMIHYYESENNISGMRHAKEKYLADLESFKIFSSVFEKLQE